MTSAVEAIQVSNRATEMQGPAHSFATQESSRARALADFYGLSGPGSPWKRHFEAHHALGGLGVRSSHGYGEVASIAGLRPSSHALDALLRSLRAPRVVDTFATAAMPRVARDPFFSNKL